MPETQGRSAAGVSHMSSGHASPTTAIAAPPASSGRTLRLTHSHASTMPGSTSSAAAIFASKPRPTMTPDHTSHFVRPSSSPRTANHTAAVTQSTSSASGLLWREIATVIGVSASTRPAAKAAPRPNGRRTRA